MTEIFFSIIIWVHDTNLVFYRDLLESIVQQNYGNMEVYILDESMDDTLGTILKEFFPEDNQDVRIHYRKLKKYNGGAYAYNIGTHFASGDYVLFVGQHDRLAPGCLLELNWHLTEGEGAGKEFIYADHGEIHGLDVEKPHYKGGFNKELLLNRDYIGDFICVKSETLRRLGDFNEKLKWSYIYDMILRAAYKKVTFYNVPSLLYLKRIEYEANTRANKLDKIKRLRERISVIKAHLVLMQVRNEIHPDNNRLSWNIEYSSEGYKKYGKDYILLKDENVRLLTKNAAKVMYGYLQQPDVAVVGVRFLGGLFTTDNIGFIYDETGSIYPAFHGRRFYQVSYEMLDTVPRDVSLVDPGFCMIDAKIYKKLGGMDPMLTGREAMLDFCIRARQAGYRTVVVPNLIAKYKVKEVISSESSYRNLMAKHGQTISKGDYYYSPNLVMGLENYILPGQESNNYQEPQAGNTVENSRPRVAGPISISTPEPLDSQGTKVDNIGDILNRDYKA